MQSRRQLSRQALRGALETRHAAGIPKDLPLCAFDLAESLGLEVRFVDKGSLDGMYVKHLEAILLPSRAHRPPGRQAFSCAHELGHWFFAHGTRVDDLNCDARDADDDEEFLADAYAAYLLMPPWATASAFHDRGWNPTTCNPAQMYIIASQLGVGYETLLTHLSASLQMISRNRSEQLLRTTPKLIRETLLGRSATPHLLVADRQWNTNVAIDLQVDDCVLLPDGVHIEGSSVAIRQGCDSQLVVTACTPGISRATTSDETWSAYIRVSRKNFEGRSIYRHFEDPDVDSASGDSGLH